MGLNKSVLEAVIKYIFGIISAVIAFYAWLEIIVLLADSDIAIFQIAALVLSYLSPIGWVFFSALGFGIYFVFAFFLNKVIRENDNS